MPAHTAASYRSVLDRLLQASRVLADYIETSTDGTTGLTANAHFFEIWADYKRTLAESQDAFRRMPNRVKLGTPKPPYE